MSNDNNIAASDRDGCTGWFVGIIVALALLSIGYLVFSADQGPQVTKIEVSGQ